MEAEVTEDLPSSLPGHDIIVIGASAGGVEALTKMVSHFPPELPAAIFIVLHVPADGVSTLPAILSRHGPLPAHHATHQEQIRHGQIYVAPPDHHLLIGDGEISLAHGPAENGHRPAVDTLFRSAARAYGSRVAGVVLTGTLDDGTAGLHAIKMRGGVALVQDLNEALFTSMPRNAIENVAVDFVEPLTSLALTLNTLAHTPVSPGNKTAASSQNTTDKIVTEVEVAELDMSALEAPREGNPSAFSCPNCHGVLWEVHEGSLTRFRCRVGHAFSPESLLAAHSDTLEEALWVALRALEESAAMGKRLGERAQERGHNLTAARFAEQTDDARQRAAVIRKALSGGRITAKIGSPFPENDEN